jgi:WD40 repeat protein
MACRLVFQQLSELDKGRAVRRRAEADELLAVCGPEADPVIAAFRSEGFLVARENPVDITHESILREWPKVAEWLEEEQRNAKRLHELAEAAKDAGWQPGLSEKGRRVRGLEGLTLQNLTAWREEARPTPAWARRYLTPVDFETANGYLTWSQTLDRQRKGRVRLLERSVLALAVLVALALGAGVLEFRRQRETALRVAKVAQNLAEQAKASEAKAKTALDNLTKSQEGLQGSLNVQQNLARDARAGELAAYAAQLQTQDPTLALYLGLQAGSIAKTPPRGLESILATALTNGVSYRVFRCPEPVAAVAWSPDGKTLASADGDGKVRLWLIAGNGQPRALEAEPGPVDSEQQGPIRAIEWSPDGKMLASDIGKNVGLWNATKGQLVRTLEVGASSPISSLAWSRDGMTLATGANDTILWNVTTGSQLLRRRSSAYGLAWDPDGKTLAWATVSGRVALLDIASQSVRELPTPGSGSAIDIAWSPDKKTIAVAKSDYDIPLRDITRDLPSRILRGHQSWVLKVAWSPDGKTLASASMDQTIRLWDTDQTRPLGFSEFNRTFQGHRGFVRSVAWSPDGKTLASGSNDRTIRLWEAQGDQSLRTLQTGGRSLAWSSDGKMLATSNGLIRTWSVSTGQSRLFPSSGGFVDKAAWSPDGKILAAARDDRTIRLWDVESGKEARVLRGHDYPVTDLAWSPDGETLASTSVDRTVRVWQTSRGQTLHILRGHSNDVTGVTWSPDRKTLASSSLDETVRLWDTATGQLLHTLNNSNPVRSVAWSGDGKTVAAAGQDRIIRLWQAATGRLLRTIEGHQGWVYSLVYSPDGKTLGSASQDGTIRLWDAVTGQSLRTLEGHRSAVRQVAWSPDGQMLTSASEDGTIRFWPGTTSALLDQVRDRLQLYTPASDECQRFFASPSCPPVRGLKLLP